MVYKTEFAEEILALIALARARMKMSQEELSEAVGQNKQYLSNHKTRGTLTQMPVKTLLMLAAYAGRDITVTRA